MQRVAELVAANKLGEALVRLWVLAGKHDGSDSTLNRWQGERDANAFDAQVEEFEQLLEREARLSARQIEARALAFLTALDRTHASLTTTVSPWSATPYVEEASKYWLVPVECVGRGEVSLARQPGNREAWLHWHAVIPCRTPHGIEVHARVATGRLADTLANLRESQQPLAVWIGHFNDDSHLAWDESPAKRFLVRRVDPHDARSNSITRNLEAARAAGALIVVLPELTVDLDARAEINEWMRAQLTPPFELVLAGAFHEQAVAGDPTSGWYNTAHLLSRDVETLLTHRKLRLFGAADGFAEDVQAGNAVTILVTPIGTLTVLICKDFLDADDSVATLLQEVPVDWVIVPSYGDEKTVSAHRTRAKVVATIGPGASVIVANQRNVDVLQGPPLPGFAHAAATGEPQEAGLDGKLIRLPIRTSKPQKRIVLQVRARRRNG